MTFGEENLSRFSGRSSEIVDLSSSFVDESESNSGRELLVRPPIRFRSAVVRIISSHSCVLNNGFETYTSS